MSLVSKYRNPARVALESTVDRCIAEGSPVVVEIAPAPVVAVVEEPAPVVAPTSDEIPAGALEHPYNAVTGARYGGKNIDRLRIAAFEQSFGAGGWAGFQQWLTVGRVVMRGQKGTACVTVMSSKRGESSDAESSDGKTTRKASGIRGFRVFHYDQTTEIGEEQS